MVPASHELYPKLESADSYTYSGKLMALNQLLMDCGIGECDLEDRRLPTEICS